jgi:pimeloyl-ACP methyl ester carboxylesterase
MEREHAVLIRRLLKFIAIGLPVLICLPLFILFSCSGSSRTDGVESQHTHVILSIPLDPLESPFPTDLFRDAETGMNAVPLTGSSGLDPITAQLNELNGFSVSAPFRIPCSGALDESSLTAESVLVMDLENPDEAPSFQLALERDASGELSVISVLPLRPLTAGRTYLVVVTRQVLDVSGEPMGSGPYGPYVRETSPLVDSAERSLHPGLSDEEARLLEPVRLGLQTAWESAEAVTGVGREEIPFAFTFTTQSLFSTLERLRQQAQDLNPTPEIVFGVTGFGSVNLLFELFGADFVPHDRIFAVYLGRFPTPHYIQDPMDGPFEFSEDGGVKEAFEEDLEFIAALPEGEGPFPVILFAHGVTRSKEDLLALANAACARGTAVIGIDLVLHGTRTRDLDLVNNETGDSVPDGIPDPSGTHFINMENLAVSRDNVRQTVADFFALARMIRNGASDFDGNGSPELSSDQLAFVGMSLGGIVGMPYVAMERGLKSAVINVAGGRLISLLRHSASIGPELTQSVSRLGIQPETPEFEWFLAAAQTVSDDADAFAYGGRFAHDPDPEAAGGILLQEMIGDLVVPNSGTRDLAHALRVVQVDPIQPVEGLETSFTPFQGTGLYQYDDGGHRAFLDVTDGPTDLIQEQAMTYLQSAFDGTGPTIVDPCAVQGETVSGPAVLRQLPDFEEGRRRLAGCGGEDIFRTRRRGSVR